MGKCTKTTGWKKAKKKKQERKKIMKNITYFTVNHK